MPRSIAFRHGGIVCPLRRTWYPNGTDHGWTVRRDRGADARPGHRPGHGDVRRRV